jgi:hypothetical protein
MVAPTNVPADSALHAMQPDADYWDAYEVALSGTPPSALQAYLEITACTPKWIDSLMSVRNAVVRLLALKDVGKLGNLPPLSAAAGLGPGDKVGIFTIRSVCDKEVVLEILDSHLDVVVSVYRHEGMPARLTVSTMVFYHNWIGRLYMVPVAPMHRIVVRAILSQSRTPSGAPPCMPLV